MAALFSCVAGKGKDGELNARALVSEAAVTSQS